MPTAYIAGPMHRIDNFNFPAFDKARDLGLSLGWGIISPADMDRDKGFDETAKHNLTPADIKEFALRDTDAILSLLAEEGDAIALLPWWQASKGATAEFFLARWLGLAVLDATTFKPYERQVCLTFLTAEPGDSSLVVQSGIGTTQNPAPGS